MGARAQVELGYLIICNLMKDKHNDVGILVGVDMDFEYEIEYHL